MSNSCTVVINAAGTGSRLGLNLPKSLVTVAGKTLIEHQLNLLKDVEDVTIVVGFKGRELVDVIWQIRRNVLVAINHDYLNTGTAHSLSIGARTTKSRIVSLDGDLLVEAKDFKQILDKSENYLGLSPRKSKLPVLANVKNNSVLDLSFDIDTNLEWTGLMNIENNKARQIGSNHVFEGLKRYLPIKAININCFEIDEAQDISEAEIWFRNLKDSYE
jgi:choline kinase